MHDNSHTAPNIDQVANLLRDLDSDDALLTEVQLAAARSLIRRGELLNAGDLLLQIADQVGGASHAKAVSEELVALAKRQPQSDERLLRAAASLAPDLGAAPLARCLQKQGKHAEAIDACREAVKTAPQDANNYLALARLYRKTGDPANALESALDMVANAPSARSTLHAAQLLDELAPSLPEPGPGPRVRIALLGNATLDHLKSYLAVECYRAGLRPEIYVGGFDQFTQEILDERSALYQFAPDVLVLAVHASKVFPRLHSYPFDLTVEERCAEMAQGLAHLESLLAIFTQRSTALVLVHNFAIPQYPVLGILDSRDELGQVQAFTEINLRLGAMARESFKNVYIVDEERVQARAGKAAAADARMWFSAKIPWSDAVHAGLAHEYLRYIRPLEGLARKCIVLDLDNTLWGGVIGEDGLAGINLGSEAPGNAFVAFQRELEKLWRRGVLLAVASKNNPEDALPVLDNHPDMVLRRSHFAALRINWEQKAANIREIAQELNIGLDSLVFLDDNPVERARVRAELPQVLVPEMPMDPALYRALLLQLDAFDNLALTDEDRNRNRLYAEQKARQEYESALNTDTPVEEYLRGLHMVVEVSPANSLTLPRIAQLTNKTNQFNLTTRRYSEAQIIELQTRGSEIYSLNARDRFGDNGLVAVAILSPVDDRTWEVDTLLMSCRVMGRGVETAFLAALTGVLRSKGTTTLLGRFIPTAKNAPARDFYRQHGFLLVEAAEGGEELWSANLQQHTIECPRWLEMRADMLQLAP